MIEIPPYFLTIPYNAAHYPGAESNGLEGGANCQVFAYELLRHFGVEAPAFRSSELWDDTLFTKQVSTLEPFDILLWNRTNKAWGAHVGVYLGENLAIHLSKKAHLPKIWGLEKFAEKPEYEVFIGAKRCLEKA